jgi:hypothetical protein
MPKSSQKPSIPRLQVGHGRAIALSPESEDTFSLAAEPSPGGQRSFSVNAEPNEDMGIQPTPEVADVELESSMSEQSFGLGQSSPPQTQDDDHSMHGSPSPQSSQYSFGIESTPLPEDLEELMLSQVLFSASAAAEGRVVLREDAPMLPGASGVVGSPAKEHTNNTGLSAAPGESYYQ